MGARCLIVTLYTLHLWIKVLKVKFSVVRLIYRSRLTGSFEKLWYLKGMQRSALMRQYCFLFHIHVLFVSEKSVFSCLLACMPGHRKGSLACSSFKKVVWTNHANSY